MTNFFASARVLSALALALFLASSASAQTLQPAAAAAAAQLPPSGPTIRLTVDEAVRLALDQNLGIQIERLNPRIEDLSIAQARSFWTPVASSSVSSSNFNQPIGNLFAGAQGKLTTDQFNTSFGADQLLRWGGNYSISWDTFRRETNSLFDSPNPALNSTLAFQYVQPLLRNFKIDSARQQLAVTLNSRQIADIDLQRALASTTRNVQQAYWDLSFALSYLAVQRQSLDLARESLRNNRTRVEIGTMAPIDIIEAQAEVATREEAVILAEASIESAQDRLRALIFSPDRADFWNTRLELTDMPRAEIGTDTQIAPAGVDAIVSSALSKRTDLRGAAKTLDTSRLNIRYFRNQTLPDVSASATYNVRANGGTRYDFGPGFPPTIQGSSRRGYGSVFSDLFANEFPSWTFALNVSYPIGTSSAEANLARSQLQLTQSEKQIDNIKLQIATEVRGVARQVNTNLKRVQASRAARELAEKRLEAEEKKFTAGMSTTFLVFQAQRDLAQARNNELRAILDYSKSLIDLDTVQVAPLSGGGGGISVVGAGGGGAPVGAGGGVQGGPTAQGPQRQ